VNEEALTHSGLSSQKQTNNIMTTELLYADTFNAMKIIFYVTASSTWAGIAESV